jgi:hypothetical protein
MPTLAATWPGLHCAHSVLLLAISFEYLPAAQAVHTLAPVVLPLPVTEPAPHVVHDATSDASEYVPAAHAMHELAPVLVPESVMEPAKHTLQKPWPAASW